MTEIDLTRLTNPQPHPNVLLQQHALPDLRGIRLKAENCMNEKVTVSLPAPAEPERPEHPGRPGKPHHFHADSFQHQAAPADPGIYDRFGRQPHFDEHQQRPPHFDEHQQRPPHFDEHQHRPPHFDEHQHRPPHDCPGKPQTTVSLTFIKPLSLNPTSLQLPDRQSIPTDADGTAWLVQPDDTIQKVQITLSLKQLAAAASAANYKSHTNH